MEARGSTKELEKAKVEHLLDVAAVSEEDDSLICEEKTILWNTLAEEAFEDLFKATLTQGDKETLKTSLGHIYDLLKEGMASKQIDGSEAHAIGANLKDLIGDLSQEDKYQQLAYTVASFENKHPALSRAINQFSSQAHQFAFPEQEDDSEFTDDDFDDQDPLVQQAHPHLDLEVKDDKHQGENNGLTEYLNEVKAIQAGLSQSLSLDQNNAELKEFNNQIEALISTLRVDEDEDEDAVLAIALHVKNVVKEMSALSHELFDTIHFFDQSVNGKEYEDLKTNKPELHQKLNALSAAAYRLAALALFEKAKAQYKERTELLKNRWDKKMITAASTLEAKLEAVQTESLADLKNGINAPEETCLIAQETWKLLGKLTGDILLDKSRGETFDTAAQAYQNTIKPCIKTPRSKREVAAIVGAFLGFWLLATAGFFAAGVEAAYGAGAAGAVLGAAIGYNIAIWHSKQYHQATQFKNEARRFMNMERGLHKKT